MVLNLLKEAVALLTIFIVKIKFDFRVKRSEQLFLEVRLVSKHP